VAVKNSIDVMYFACDIVAHSLFVEGGAQLDQNGFDQAWDMLGRDNERYGLSTNQLMKRGIVIFLSCELFLCVKRIPTGMKNSWQEFGVQSIAHIFPLQAV
jgi:hypothetical protein